MQIGQKIRKLSNFMIYPPSSLSSKITDTFLDRFFQKFIKKYPQRSTSNRFFSKTHQNHYFLNQLSFLLHLFALFFPDFSKKGFERHFFKKNGIFYKWNKKNQVTVKKDHFSISKAFLKRYLPIFLEKTSQSFMWHVYLAQLSIQNVEIFRFFCPSLPDILIETKP